MHQGERSVFYLLSLIVSDIPHIKMNLGPSVGTDEKWEQLFKQKLDIYSDGWNEYAY